MNGWKAISMAIIAAVALSACGNDSEDNGGNKAETNANKNIATANTPAEITHLEFPKVKGGSSEVIVHSTAQYGMTYALEWDHTKRAQRWTCFEITAANRVKNWSRYKWNSTSWGGDPFQLDPKVPKNEQPPVRGEFSGSYYPDGGKSYYQRGHICASEDRVYSKDANEQTFYMTNMMPQVGNFNGKIWAKLEERVRTLALNTDTLFVCKGGTIDNSEQILGYTRSRFIVPRYFFMALLAKNKLGYKAIGFWVEHLNEDHSNDKLGIYAVNIADLEKKTGIDFFCNLPDDIEKQVETLDIDNVKRAWGF
ncbi:DNA/RNA non-specific endonuclease [Hoylesella oralis]|uniref:DNA/RNA non-specific endonuclease n=1 Tax=Hoylesella oralis TaxID=28134 RepID=UPI0028E96FDA|nr:DNA/RNA non-specific endonuclease [Hoylesella oralis]